MSLTTLQIITLRTPQFASDARLNDMISLATQITGSAYGSNTNYAIALRVMHWFTREAMFGGTSTNTGIQSGGQIKSTKEGKLSRSYATGDTSKNFNSESDLLSTGFGKELMNLTTGSIVLPMNRLC